MTRRRNDWQRVEHSTDYVAMDHVHAKPTTNNYKVNSSNAHFIETAHNRHLSFVCAKCGCDWPVVDEHVKHVYQEPHLRAYSNKDSK